MPSTRVIYQSDQKKFLPLVRVRAEKKSKYGIWRRNEKAYSSYPKMVDLKI
jgi:hypothetical protein